MMSHLDPAKGGNNKPPCLKSRRRPTEQVTPRLRLPRAHHMSPPHRPTLPFLLQVELAEAVDAPREAWCAAHLNMLCQHALQVHATYMRPERDR